MTNRTFKGEPVDATVSYIGDTESMQARKDANGETVEATTDDDMHDMTTDHIPSEVDLDELSEKRRKIVELAAKNPTLSAKDIDDKVGSTGYASQVLRDECPNWYQRVFKQKSPPEKRSYTTSDTDEYDGVAGYEKMPDESEENDDAPEDHEDVIQNIREIHGEGDVPDPSDTSKESSFGDELDAHMRLARIRQTCETVAHMDTPVGEFASGLLEVLEEE